MTNDENDIRGMARNPSGRWANDDGADEFKTHKPTTQRTMTHTQNFSPGIYDGIPLAVYRGARGVSNSDLRLFSRTPAHYAASLADIEPG
jgi:hypothetical protein